MSTEMFIATFHLVISQLDNFEEQLKKNILLLVNYVKTIHLFRNWRC